MHAGSRASISSLSFPFCLCTGGRKRPNNQQWQIGCCQTECRCKVTGVRNAALGIFPPHHHQDSLQFQRSGFFQVPDTQMLQEPQAFITTQTLASGELKWLFPPRPEHRQSCMRQPSRALPVQSRLNTTLQKERAFSRQDSDRVPSSVNPNTSADVVKQDSEINHPSQQCWAHQHTQGLKFISQTAASVASKNMVSKQS